MQQGHADPGNDCGRSPIPRSRPNYAGLLLVKWVILIPHYLVLCILGIAVVIVRFSSPVFAVLFTGEWPDGMRDFVIGVYRWRERVHTYLFMLSDEYQPLARLAPEAP